MHIACLASRLTVFEPTKGLIGHADNDGTGLTAHLQNPHNVAEWHKRVKLFEGQPSKQILTYTQVRRGVARPAPAGPSLLVPSCTTSACMFWPRSTAHMQPA
jgi:hypothetical protein